MWLPEGCKLTTAQLHRAVAAGSPAWRLGPPLPCVPPAPSSQPAACQWRHAAPTHAQHSPHAAPARRDVVHTGARDAGDRCNDSADCSLDAGMCACDTGTACAVSAHKQHRSTGPATSSSIPAATAITTRDPPALTSSCCCRLSTSDSRAAASLPEVPGRVGSRSRSCDMCEGMCSMVASFSARSSSCDMPQCVQEGAKSRPRCGALECMPHHNRHCRTPTTTASQSACDQLKS